MLAAWLGIAASLLYAATTLIGGLVTPGYSHLANMISELTMATAAWRWPVAAFFVLYNLLLIGFAVLLPRVLPTGRGVLVGSVLLVVIALAGIDMVTAFPTDRPTDPLTLTGWVHVVLAGIASIGTMGAVLAFALTLRRTSAWRPFANISFACLAGIFVSGIWTAATAAQLSPLMGLAERLTIGIFMVWLFAFGVTVTRHRGEAATAT